MIDTHDFDNKLMINGKIKVGRRMEVEVQQNGNNFPYMTQQWKQTKIVKCHKMK